jgi:hypothetical protein
MQCRVSFSRCADCDSYVRVLVQAASSATELQRWAWVAGLFEGEGSVILSADGPTRYQRRLDITNTERDILEQAIEFSGLGRIAADMTRTRPAHYKQRLYWFVSAWREIEEVANRTYPFLGGRRRARLGELFDHAPASAMELSGHGNRRRLKLTVLRDPRTITRQPADDEWWAWAAGLFEGEGSAVCRPMSRRRKGLQRRLQLPMSDEDVLLRFREVVGAGSVRRIKTRLLTDKGNPRKPMFRWTCSKWSDTERIARAFYPLLCARRRRQVDWLLAHPIGLMGWASRTTCIRGHPISGPDADIYRYGRARQCRKCHAEGYRARRAQRVALVAAGEDIKLMRPAKVCKRGHPLDGPDADVYVYYGWRQCRRCIRERKRVGRSRRPKRQP